ncbi:MAG: ROK family protein, partial [Chitinophagaceae bacterium]
RLYFQESQSCNELSLWLKKSIPLVTRVLNELIEENFVVTNGYAPSTGGRKPLSYSLNADKGYILAVAMDQLFTQMVLVDLMGRQLTAPFIIELDLYENGNSLEILAQSLQEYVKKSDIDKSRIIGAGIAMPGFVNKEAGMNYTFFQQQMKVSHRAFLEKALDIPVFIDNDSSLTALGEWTFGSAKDVKNAMIINVGWGTGLGMIVDGQLFRGDSGYAGEFSHIPLTDNGVLCECGKKGCLETETSLLIMAKKAVDDIQAGLVSGLKLKDVKYMSDVIIGAAKNGDQYCIELLTHLGFMLGKGIAILIHIMNPGVVVLSGRGAKAEKILRAPVQQALNQYCIPRIAENTQILFSHLGEDAGLVGAAALVMEYVKLYKKLPMVSKN